MRGEIRDEMCVFYSNGFIWKIPSNQNKKKAEVGVLLPISVVLVLREVTKKDLSVFANQTDGVSSVGGRYDRPRWQPYWLPLYDSFRVNNLFNVYAPIHTEYFNTCLLVVVGFFWIF